MSDFSTTTAWDLYREVWGSHGEFVIDGNLKACRLVAKRIDCCPKMDTRLPPNRGFEAMAPTDGSLLYLTFFTIVPHLGQTTVAHSSGLMSACHSIRPW